MKPELLSPAGSPESLRAAVQNGAGAVYLGWGEFNARRGAKNFSDEEFAQALRYCHERTPGCFSPSIRWSRTGSCRRRWRPPELPAGWAWTPFWCRTGAFFDLLRRCLPDQPLHASTQMSVFTSGGAVELAQDGCERVVIARECSKEDSAAICHNCPVEVEVFVHGALCMCYSGQCAMSALIGGRSGNRGRCAQPCRLPYGVDGPRPGTP